MRGERVGELGRECLLGRARGRAGLIAGQAGMEPGRVRGGTGPAREEKKKRVGRLAEVVGRNGFWIFWVWVSFFFYFLFSFLFLLQTKFEFKYKFEFKPHSNKSMHQHECNTNFFKLRQVLIACETKLN